MEAFIIIAIVILAASSIIGYLLGSVNFAIIVTRVIAHDDIRKHGSGNAGMTNVLRTLGKGPALVTLIGDFSKGIIAVLIYRILLMLVLGASSQDGEYIVAFAALLGHLFPIFYGFKGGKGVLVSFGALIILAPMSALICLAVFIIVTAVSRYISLGSIVAAAVFPLANALISVQNGEVDWHRVVFSIPIALLIIFMHRGNIKRLASHSENKISLGSKK